MLYHPPTGGAPNDPYVGKTASTNGSKVPPGAIEYTQREIIAAITAANLTPTDADLTQLMQAISILSRLSHGSVRQVTAGTYSWTCPSGVTRVRARVTGGGGGGSGGGNAAGCGGGYSEGFYTVVPGTSYPYIVGAGGTGNPGTSTGGTGGTSSFASFLSATGGYGGSAGPQTGGAGSGGNLLNLLGGRGEDLESNNYYAQGGYSPFGGIGQYQSTSGPGAGGSATSSGAVIGANGYNGADGAVSLDW